jgi:hypothetical protein
MQQAVGRAQMRRTAEWWRLPDFVQQRVEIQAKVFLLVPGRIEIPVGPASLGLSVANELLQRIQSRDCDITVALQITGPVEQSEVRQCLDQ